ncbi:MAG TPA: LptF/LptG family permease [Thermodesulfovibrionales bacterium]|nr:LptF/LptG family permease [Thermodesulfovibrionales bacterium]
MPNRSGGKTEFLSALQRAHRIPLKIIHLSILKELVATFLLSVICLNFILMMEKVLRLSRVLSGVGASLSDMIRIILYLQPQLMILTIPMSLLLSTLLTYGRLNTDNELTILRTAGMSFRHISRPVFILGTASFVMGLLVSFSLGPYGAIQMRKSIATIVTQKAPLAIEAGIFNTSFKDIVILVRDKPAADEMKGIFIYDNRNAQEPKVLVAKEGRVYADKEYNLSLYMRDGYIHITRNEGSTELFFDGYNLSLNLAMESSSRKNSEMTPFELLALARKNEPKEGIPFLLEFHRRLSLPSLCLLLMFLGPPLSLLSGKSGRLGGLSLGIGVFTLFYIMLVYGENMARTGVVPHVIGAWTPVLIIAVSSLLAFMKVESR